MQRIMVFALVVAIFSVFVPSAAAQADCPPSEHSAWQQTAISVYFEYNTALETEGDLERAAALQALRRRLESAVRPACDDAAYEHLANALNWTADSIIAALTGDEALGTELLARAGAEHVEAGALLVGGSGVVAPTATITEPADRVVVAGADLVVRGNYDASVFGPDSEKQIWIFVVPPNQRYYPQIVNDACNPTERASVSYTPMGWNVNAQLGGETPNMRYDIVLAIGDAAATAAIFDKYNDDWCLRGEYPGLTSDEVFFEMGFEVVESINVTRQ